MIGKLLMAGAGTRKRGLLVALATLSLASPTLTEARQATGKAFDRDAYDARIKALIANPPLQTAERVPDGYKLGRCLLKVDGKRLISGPCVYVIGEGGSFQFHGSHQVHVGIDYPDINCHLCEISTDYFVDVDRFNDDPDPETGTPWYAHWNEDKRATHAQSYLGPVVRDGACYSNARTRICLWKV